MANFFLVNEVRGQREEEVTRVSILDVATEEGRNVLRNTAISQARANALLGKRTFVYGPTESGDQTVDDRIWDSQADL